MTALVRWIQQETGQVLFVRSDFPLYGEYTDWLEEGKKVTTIRFRKGALEIPKGRILPLFSTADFTQKRAQRPMTSVAVNSVKYQRFGELDDEDAARDGFKSVAEMRHALTTIYPTLELK